MSGLMEELNARAIDLGVPLGVHLDLTYRCNERCVHCYLDHDDLGEMTYEEIHRLLGQMAEAGVFILTLSGGEPLLRKDFFAILRRASVLGFNIKLKTNALLIHEREAALIRELGVDSIQVSVYSHRPEVHDAITKVKGSLERSLKAIRFMVSQELRVTLATPLMRQNVADYPRVQALARELGAQFELDPTITPHLNGDRSLLSLNVAREDLARVLHDENVVGNVAEFCAPPAPADASVLDEVPCSAGHSYCYVSPYGEVYPCVQFPLPSGNVRHQDFIDIWKNSPQLNEVRTIRTRDLPICSTCPNVGSCSRCPGLAYKEGNMRGPSAADCEKSYLRSGVPSAAMMMRRAAS
ncbi:MAG: radical SAM/SPASM domain-containing protein [Candidatus Binataceae bacterium]